MAKNNQYTPGQLSLQYTIFIFRPVYFMHLCCDKQVIKWLPKPIHVSSGLFYYNSNSYEPDINSIKDSEEQLSEKVCFWLVFLQNTALKCVSVVDFWHHTTAYKHSGEQIQVSNINFVCTTSAYTYRLERVGHWHFLTPIDDNRWVATTFVWLSNFHRLADANRCQLTNKASIVIDWFSDHRFHRLFTPCITAYVNIYQALTASLPVELSYVQLCRQARSCWQWKYFSVNINCGRIVLLYS